MFPGFNEAPANKAGEALKELIEEATEDYGFNEAPANKAGEAESALVHQFGSTSGFNEAPANKAGEALRRQIEGGNLGFVSMRLRPIRPEKRSDRD